MDDEREDIEPPKDEELGQETGRWPLREDRNEGYDTPNPEPDPHNEKPEEGTKP